MKNDKKVVTGTQSGVLNIWSETEKWELIKPYVKDFQNNYVIR